MLMGGMQSHCVWITERMSEEVDPAGCVVQTADVLGYCVGS